MRICKVEDCGRKHEAKGFCKSHYQQYRAHGKIVSAEIRAMDSHRGCKVEGCSNNHHSGGYCRKHYCQIWAYNKIFDRTIFDKNEIVFRDNIAEVILYSVKHNEVGRSIIDKEDVEKVKKHKWYLDNLITMQRQE